MHKNSLFCLILNGNVYEVKIDQGRDELNGKPINVYNRVFTISERTSPKIPKTTVS